MQITTKLNHLSSNFIEDYLTSLGITNIKRYLKPTKQSFENPNHYEFINTAIKVFNNYIQTDIGIVIDSDMDGACSAALIYNFIKILNPNASIHIFYHKGKEHGIKDVLNEIIESDICLLIIPDAGTNDIEECARLKAENIEVIILDHHLQEKQNNYAYIINNQQPTVENKALSGTGVVDKFVRKYCTTYDIKYPDYTDLVAVSIVSDICDLITLENRAYVYYGLNNITNPFLSFLFEKLCKRRGYTPEAISWDISPLANALARSNEQEDKTLFFDALVGKTSPEEALKKLRKIKRIQDEEVKSVVDEIESDLNVSSKVIVGFTEPENVNFIGLIANKITGKYNKPTILLRDTGYGSWSGSLRSPVPLATQINNSGFAKAQGHEEACGVMVKKNNFDSFVKWLDTLNLSEKPSTEVTAKINPKDITLDICQVISEWKQLWGKGIEAPTFAIETTLTKDKVFVFEKSSKTLKLDLGNVACLKFFASDNDIKAFRKYDKFNVQLIVGDLDINEYEGVRTPQAMIKDYEITPILQEEERWEDSF